MIEAPPELAARAQWVVWRYVQRPGESKPTKVPVNARTGANASTTDAATWSTYVEANTYFATGHADGIGYVLSEDDPYSGVDLDHCRDPASGRIEPWAKAIVARLNSYTEISPSGAGLRIFVVGDLPPHGRHKGAIEVYCRARFLTITGDRYMAAPGTIQHRQDELLAWHRDVFGDGKAKTTTSNGHRPLLPRSLLDTELLVKAQSANNGGKFNALWNGDYSSYASQSEADLALANYLAFYCGPDPSRIDALFRLSGMFREKWEEREDYRAWTINKALEGRSEYYDLHYRSNANGSSFGVGVDPDRAASPDGEAATEIGWELMTATPEVSVALVEHFLWQGRTHWMYSAPGGGKTLLELALLMHMAAGLPFHDHAVVQGPVLILEEDSPRAVVADYLRMLADIYEIDMRTVPLYFFRKRGLTLKDREGFEYAKTVIADMPVKPVVFAIDACERVVPSDSFSSRELEWVARLFAENLADGITNVMIDHTRKPQPSGGEKIDPMELLYGSRVKSAISDVMMYLSGQIRNKALLSFPKFRGDAPAPIAISFEGATGFTIKTQKIQLSESERSVMLVMNNSFGKSLSAEEIAELASLNDRTTRRVLKTLVDLGWVEHSGETRGSRYRANASAGGGLFS